MGAEKHSPRETEQLNINGIKRAAKKYLYNEKALIIGLLIIVLFLSSFFRLYPVSLPVTQQWAEDSYTNQLQQQIAAQIQQQYPNLPAAQQQAFIKERVDEQLSQDNPELQQQIQQTGEYFKSQLQDEEGNTYLLAIDPYLYHSYARNYVENSHPGTTLTDGVPNFELRNGREPRLQSFVAHSFFMTQFYYVLSPFTGWNLQQAVFYFPVFIIGLAVICAFFLARRIAGNLAGFVAGAALALNTALLGRTPAGFSDTDAYIVFFPLLVTWLVVEGLYAKKWKKYALLAGAGLAQSIFMITWPTGWHIATVLISVIGIYFLYKLVTEWKVVKKDVRRFFDTDAGQLLVSAVTFILSIGVFSQLLGWLTRSPQTFGRALKNVLLGPLSALSIKDVASIDIWPNVLTTVAELNPGSWPQVMGSIGGQAFLIIAILGALLAALPRERKKSIKDIRIYYPVLLILWFGGLTFAGILAARFIALLAAPFAIAFGVFFGMLWILTKRIKQKDFLIGTRVIIVILVAILFIGPVQAAHRVGLQEVPSMNDAWHDSLSGIGDDTEQGIITSWWDFGHWFVNVAEEHVTFDGGDQGKRIYWVGKLLMTPDAQENTDILRMLNCGQNVGYERILEATNNNYQASILINDIVGQDPDEASATLASAGLSQTQIDSVLEKTHCADDTLYDQYVIASQDMIGKAGVWAHFGGWNFTRANIYSNLRNQPYEEALASMQAMGITDEDEAAKLYFEARNLRGSRAVDSWISPWPSYVTQQPSQCQNLNESYRCSMGMTLNSQGAARLVLQGVEVDKEDLSASYLQLVTYQGAQAVESQQLKPEKITLWQDGEWVSQGFENSTFPYEFVVAPDESGEYFVIAGQDALADSAFSKMFFFDGTGLEDYDKFSEHRSFSGQTIIVYKVDLTRGWN